MTPFAPPLDAEALRAMYPERDGKPMSDNMTQARWIHLLFGNLCALLADRDDAFVASDNLWYPDEQQRDLRQAPDVYVVFGRPKGDRGSYMQWLEDDVPIAVVFEILSPGNTDEEMIAKFDFYDHYGVEEYYIYDPATNKLHIYTRGQATLRLHRAIRTFTSPRLGIRFEMTRPEMTVYRPNGVRFRTLEELEAQYEEATEGRETAERQADEAKRLAAARGKLSDEAAKRADDNARRADEATKRADDNARRAARLAELSRRARRGQATPDELAELDRLEEGIA